MADKNEVILEGVIKGKVFNFWGKEGKTSVLKINLECNSEYAGSDGKLNTKTCTAPVTMFGHLADKHKPDGAGGGFVEGLRVRVSGYITNNSYVSKKTNERVFETVVIARTVDVLGDRTPSKVWDGGPPAYDDTSIPF